MAHPGPAPARHPSRLPIAAGTLALITALVSVVGFVVGGGNLTPFLPIRAVAVLLLVSGSSLLLRRVRAGSRTVQLGALAMVANAAEFGFTTGTPALGSILTDSLAEILALVTILLATLPGTRAALAPQPPQPGYPAPPGFFPPPPGFPPPGMPQPGYGPPPGGSPPPGMPPQRGFPQPGPPPGFPPQPGPQQGMPPQQGFPPPGATPSGPSPGYRPPG